MKDHGSAEIAHACVRWLQCVNDRFWPKAAVMGIRPGWQLSEDELPYTAIEHDGRI